MTTKPRNRVVVFRLSQEEYRSLKEASERHGARNLSDFTRSELMEYVRAAALGDPLHRRFAYIEKQLAAVQDQLDRLLQGVSHVAPQPRP